MNRALRSAVPLVALVLVAMSLMISGCGVTEPEKVVEDVQNQAIDAARQANLRMIDSAIQAYYAEKGTWPTSINELAAYFGGRMPTDPGGGTFYIVMENGQAKAAVR